MPTFTLVDGVSTDEYTAPSDGYIQVTAVVRDIAWAGTSAYSFQFHHVSGPALPSGNLYVTGWNSPFPTTTGPGVNRWDTATDPPPTGWKGDDGVHIGVWRPPFLYWGEGSPDANNSGAFAILSGTKIKLGVDFVQAGYNGSVTFCFTTAVPNGSAETGCAQSSTLPVVGVFDPSGVSIVTFDNLIDHTERIEYNGTGSGMLIINRHDPQATAANLAKGNIVRVTYSEIDPDPTAEWIIETGDFELVSSDEEGGEDLTFSGRGSLALAAYTILGHQNLTNPKRNYPKEGVWRWTSEEWAGIVRRTIDESQAHTPPALTMITRDWSDTIDSLGQPFFDMDGDWEIRIGTDLLTAWMDLARAGMGQLEMRPPFLLRAYNSMGRDLSGAFGTATVRFQDGINITTEVSREMAARHWASNVLIHTKDGYLWWYALAGVNITGVAATDVLTSSSAHGMAVNDQVWFVILNGGTGLTVGTKYYVQSVPSGTTFKVSATKGGAAIDFTTDVTTGSRITSAPYIKEEELDLTNMTGTNSQERAAARKLTRGTEGLEGVIFEASPIGPAGQEHDPANGWYYPGWQGTVNGKYWIGDIVSFHTGTGELDFNEAKLRVQAITLGVDETGAMAPPIIELSSPWGGGESSGSGNSEARPATGGGSGGTGSHVHTQYQLAPVTKTTDPTVNDDADDDYIIGSRWLNTTLDREFVALDVTAGAAVWLQTTGGPVALDDLSDVVITAAATGQRLRFNGTNWVNVATIWQPLTNGDTTTPELIFAAGDVVMVEA